MNNHPNNANSISSKNYSLYAGRGRKVVTKKLGRRLSFTRRDDRVIKSKQGSQIADDDSRIFNIAKKVMGKESSLIKGLPTKEIDNKDDSSINTTRTSSSVDSTSTIETSEAFSVASTSSPKSCSIVNAPVIKLIQSNVIGARHPISTPFGKKEIVYADYTASGRALRFIEDYMVNVVLPAYANTHTEASATGAQTTHFREESRDCIRKALNAPKDEYAVLFTGSGSTAAIDKIFRAIGIGIPEYADKKWSLSKNIPEKERPVVFISHFEHHSNELIWRESIARCVVIQEGRDGTPDLAHLNRELLKYKGDNVPLIGSFSAGSNVTGIKAPVNSICRLLHRYGAYAFIDYAGVGAYVNIDMKGPPPVDGDAEDDSSIDAAFFSPHKFVGGPGSSGLLVARHRLFRKAFDIETNVPTCPGGGTVEFVSRKGQIYDDNVEHREDAGTPGILQSIRTGLVFKVKKMVGHKTIESLENIHCSLALNAWRSTRFISLVGADRVSYQVPTRRVSIFSLNVLSPIKATLVPARPSSEVGSFAQLTVEAMNHFGRVGGIDYGDTDYIPLHFNFVIALLNDIYGIQGRGGCSCTGPYGSNLFNISALDDETLAKVADFLSLHPVLKPGWARVNLNYFIPTCEASFITDAVVQIAKYGWKLLPLYVQDWKSGQYYHHSLLDPESGGKLNKQEILNSLFSINDLSLVDTPTKSENVRVTFPAPTCKTEQRSRSSYKRALSKAKEVYETRPQRDVQNFVCELDPNIKEEDIWWLLPTQAEKKLQETLISNNN